MGLKQVFEMSTFHKKIKANDILLTFDEDGEPVFHALVCIAGRNKEGKYEYSPKDLRKMGEVAEYQKRLAGFTIIPTISIEKNIQNE